MTQYADNNTLFTTAMLTKALPANLAAILHFRALFLQEANVQIRYNACHERGWSDAYLLTLDGVAVGYGSVKGLLELTDRDAVFEYYVIPPFRKLAGAFFTELLAASKARFIECQSNDPLLSAMLYEFAENIHADVVLFLDHQATALAHASAVFRRRGAQDKTIFEHTFEPVGDYVLEQDDEVVATGGFMLHYNPPFADLYMEVRPDCRRQGLGSFLVQELKRECYRSGRTPAARCSLQHPASRATLLKAGFAEAGFILTGHLR